MTKEVKCAFCGWKATHYIKVDLDIKWIPICKKKECEIKYFIETSAIFSPYEQDKK